MSNKRLKLAMRPKSILPLLALAVGALGSLKADPSFSDANWSSVGKGLSSGVRALAVAGTNLYAGGKFTINGASYIAKWDGRNWSPLGSGLDGYVYALAVSGTNLYAAGEFTHAGSLNVNYIARWNGTSWSDLAGGITGTYVQALAVSGSSLYVGGNFIHAGPYTQAYCLARWDGSSWSVVGPSLGMDNTVYALAVSGTDLYAGGYFTHAGGLTANHIAKWNGISWSALSSGMSGTDLNSVFALAFLGTNLFAGGFFTQAGTTPADDIAAWNGSSWWAPGYVSNGTNYFPSVYALTVSGTNLYAGGDFTVAGVNAASRVAASRVARWDGTNWSPLGSGVNNTVWALAVSGSDLYVAGDFTMAGNKPAQGIARAYLSPLPALSISGSAAQVVVSWPSPGTAGFALEQAGGLVPKTSWVPTAATTTDDGTNIWVTLPATNTAQFFRLRRP